MAKWKKNHVKLKLFHPIKKGEDGNPLKKMAIGILKGNYIKIVRFSDWIDYILVNGIETSLIKRDDLSSIGGEMWKREY